MKSRRSEVMGELFGKTNVSPVPGLTSNAVEVDSDEKFEWTEIAERRVLPVMTDWSRFLEDPRAVYQLEKTV